MVKGMEYRDYKVGQKRFSESTDPATIELVHNVAVEYIFLKLKENGKLR